MRKPATSGRTRILGAGGRVLPADNDAGNPAAISPGAVRRAEAVREARERLGLARRRNDPEDAAVAVRRLKELGAW